MELQNIKNLIERYFDGTTSIREEQKLKTYFSSNKIAPELEKYKDMFAYFAIEKQTESTRTITLRQKTKLNYWIAASVIMVIGVGVIFFQQPKEENLGTFDDPEIALRETQKALRLVSENINKGKEKMEYLQEFEKTKKTIFK